MAKNPGNVSNYEKSAHLLLELEGITPEIPQKLDVRARAIAELIMPYLNEGSILDLGCGDGRVGKLLAKGRRRVVLADVYKRSDIDKTGLEFELLKKDGSSGFADNEFDNTLALTVYHHSDDPVKSIRETCRTTKNGGRALVIESVYGVRGKELPPEGVRKVKSYLSLDEERQRKVNIFFDHFYNRVIHYSDNLESKVNLPYNFNTPEGWKGLFENNGFTQEKVIHLGIDQPAVPEYHTLHILRVVK